MINKLIIISGGQTGPDRATLDFAIEHNLPHEDWCPKGRKSLDGPLDGKYQLKETPSDEYLERTEWNVRDSDGTVVFTLAEKATGGSRKTLTFAAKLKKPTLHLHSGILGASEKLIAFMQSTTFAGSMSQAQESSRNQGYMRG
jgi:hypothetical protein